MYKPIDFENLPSKLTPISANNLNYIQQGILQAIQIATNVNDAYESGELKGAKGDKGEKGDQGLQGNQGEQGVRGEQGVQGARGLQGEQGDKGNDGKNFEVDGWVDSVADLPDATLNANKTFGTRAQGHLHHSDGTAWIDWGEFTGVRGEQGEQGERGIQGVKGDAGIQGIQGIQGVQGLKGDTGEDGVFDIDLITDEQLEQLHGKLKPFDDYQLWSYQTHVATGKTAKFKVADLNLDLSIARTGATIAYKFLPSDVSIPANYYVNRLSNYDFTALESTVTLSWQAQVITASGFNLDQSGYLPGREQTLIQVIDPSTNIWYSISFIGLGEGTMFIDVQKRVNKNREIITAM